jgi:hypothetical protein
MTFINGRGIVLGIFESIVLAECIWRLPGEQTKSQGYKKKNNFFLTKKVKLAHVPILF